MTQRFLDDEEIAALLGISASFLRKDRRRARRVPFIRLGDRILYDPERVREALLATEEGGKQKRRRKGKLTATELNTVPKPTVEDWRHLISALREATYFDAGFVARVIATAEVEIAKLEGDK